MSDVPAVARLAAIHAERPGGRPVDLVPSFQHLQVLLGLISAVVPALAVDALRTEREAEFYAGHNTRVLESWSVITYG